MKVRNRPMTEPTSNRGALRNYLRSIKNLAVEASHVVICAAYICQKQQTTPPHRNKFSLRVLGQWDE